MLFHKLFHQLLQILLMLQVNFQFLIKIHKNRGSYYHEYNHIKQ